ncbi:MAG: hypothetical protein V4512_06795 [Pseudomonadota bacterium]
MMRVLPKFSITEHGMGGIDADDRFSWFVGRGLLVEWGPILIEIIIAKRERVA